MRSLFNGVIIRWYQLPVVRGMGGSPMCLNANHGRAAHATEEVAHGQ